MITALLVLSVMASLGPRIEVAGSGAAGYTTQRARPDALFMAGQDPAVAWAETSTTADRPGGVNHCYVSAIAGWSPGRDEGPDRGVEIFGEVSAIATCCVDRIAVEPVGGGRSLAVTTCSMRKGFWIWSQSLDGQGRAGDVPAPVLPLADRAQHEPRLAPAPGGGLWLAWVEGDRDPAVGGIVRAARVDALGMIAAGPFDLSDGRDSIALGDPLGDHLAIAAVPSGGFVIAWSASSGSRPVGLRLRLVDAEGRPTTSEIQVTSEDDATADSPRLSVDGNGRVNVVWRRLAGARADGSAADGPPRAFFRGFTRGGEPLSDARPLAVDEPDRSQSMPRIAAAGKRHLLVWAESVGREEGGWIAVRRWAPGVGPVGLITRFPASVAWEWPLLEALPQADGGFTIYWHPSGPSGFASPGRIAWRRVVVPDAR